MRKQIVAAIRICFILLFVFSGCTNAPTNIQPTATDTAVPTQVLPVAVVNEVTPTTEPTQAEATASPSPTEAPPTATSAPTSTTGPRLTLGPDNWQNVPVVPTAVSERVKLIYQMGMLNGNDPHAFSKVGDCNTTNPYFLTDFDTEGKYDLGEFDHLQGTIEYYAGSYERTSLAAKQGLTAHASLSMLWNTWKECETYETPLECEYRIHKPMFAIISFGTNDANGNVDFEKALRRVLDMTMGNGTIPILATKADNAEGDNSFNRIIVDLANEYELPVWNYWAAVQDIPGKGLQDENPEHLSVGPKGFFSFEEANMTFGWSIRNLTALQVLDALHKLLSE